jgi:hypothetical protein
VVNEAIAIATELEKNNPAAKKEQWLHAAKTLRFPCVMFIDRYLPLQNLMFSPGSGTGPSLRQPKLASHKSVRARRLGL